ncbi:MAG: hypothetical protein AAB426_05505, partial [Myxococcota bacterium]
DLVISKYVANRPKDRRYIKDAVRFGLLDRAVLEERLASTPVDAAQRDLIDNLIARDFAR